jgi:hypothetical protein
VIVQPIRSRPKRSLRHGLARETNPCSLLRLPSSPADMGAISATNGYAPSHPDLFEVEFQPGEYSSCLKALKVRSVGSYL